MLLKNNYMNCARTLIEERLKAQLPPLTHQASFHFYSKDRKKALKLAEIIYQKLSEAKPSPWEALPPMESFSFKRLNSYRYVLILWSAHRASLNQGVKLTQNLINSLIPQPQKHTSLDLDPVTI